MGGGGGGGVQKCTFFPNKHGSQFFFNQILVLIPKIKTILTQSQYLAGISIMADMHW